VLSRDFPWRGPNARFLGYNHSIKQIVAYLGGVKPAMLRLASMIKILILAPLGWVCLKRLLHPIQKAGRDVPMLSLDFVFVLYLGAFVWLDMVWELSLGIVIFPYLLARMEHRTIRVFLWIVFLSYALVDLWRAISFMIWGTEIIAPGAYILTDPSLYVPVVMGVILTFYALLLRTLWRLGREAQTFKIQCPIMAVKG
jgi:hypothetical protein